MEELSVMEVISSISDLEGEFLINLAKKAIEYYLREKKIFNVEPSKIPYPNLTKKGACFVTIETKEGRLRGCIGSIIPYRPLYEDVINNAIWAAFFDPRFPPLTFSEFPDIKIKISILTYPEPLQYKNWEDLLDKIKPNEDGVIIKYHDRTGTFLPDVWKDIPDKELFMHYLCLKAGLNPKTCKEGKLEVYVYKTVSFGE